MNIEDILGQFNLTHQEAVLYLLLCTEGKLTGYEASKLSGISRSNTYTALANLVDKGAATIEEDTATRYIPVSVDEFCNNRLRTMKEYRDLLVQAIPEKKTGDDGYFTIKGAKNIMDKMKNIINQAQERIYIAVPEKTINYLLPELAAAQKRKLRLVVITGFDFSLDGAEIYHAKMKPEQVRLIADSRNVLTGDLSFDESSTCLYSQKKNLVDLFKESLKYEIELIKTRERG